MTVVLVSAKRAAHIRKGWRKPLPVRIRLNGQPETPWRINLTPVGDGSFYLYLHGDVRKASGTNVGEAVTVELAFDDEYQGAFTEIRRKTGRFRSSSSGSSCVVSATQPGA